MHTLYHGCGSLLRRLYFRPNRKVAAKPIPFSWCPTCLKVVKK